MMRKLPAISMLCALLLAGCSQSPRQQHTLQPEGPAQTHTADSPAVAASESPVPNASATYHIPTLDPAKEARANDDITIICSIVTHEVETHEFPQLWNEGSRESRLASEYEKLLPGELANDALMRDCPAYARLHSKNAG